MSNPLRVDGTSGLIEMTNSELLARAQAVGFSTGVNISATEPTGGEVGDLWWDSVNEQMYIFDGTDWVVFASLEVVPSLVIDQASSTGTLTTFNGDDYYVFTSSGTLVVTEGAEVPILLVGGGGVGGGTGASYPCGGAGGGGFLADDAFNIAPGTYTITIGASRNDTTAFGLTALAGGWGGGNPANGRTGGSGGGSGAQATGVATGTEAAGSGTPPQGFDGGSQQQSGGIWWAGGGGGASEAGNTDGPGDGGDGAVWHNGVTYAGGGAAQNQNRATADDANAAGIPGDGGGGQGWGTGTVRVGAANTGGGGGGAGFGDGDRMSREGGSGIVIIKMTGL